MASITAIVDRFKAELNVFERVALDVAEAADLVQSALQPAEQLAEMFWHLGRAVGSEAAGMVQGEVVGVDGIVVPAKQRQRLGAALGREHLVKTVGVTGEPIERTTASWAWALAPPVDRSASLPGAWLSVGEGGELKQCPALDTPAVEVFGAVGTRERGASGASPLITPDTNDWFANSRIISIFDHFRCLSASTARS